MAKSTDILDQRNNTIRIKYKQKKLQMQISLNDGTLASRVIV